MGLSERRNVVLIINRVDGRPITSGFGYLQEDGALITTKTPPKDGIPLSYLSEISEYQKTPFFIALGNPGYAEPFEIVVMAADEYNRIKKPMCEIAKCEIIPNELAVVDEENRKMSLKASSEDGNLFTLRISHLTPMEKITLTVRSNNETIQSTLNADANGSITTIIFPSITGQIEGIFECTISSSKMKPLSISHLWGTFAFWSPKESEVMKANLKRMYGY